MQTKQMEATVTVTTTCVIISIYHRDNWPIPVIGKTADNWPMPIIGASLF